MFIIIEGLIQSLFPGMEMVNIDNETLTQVYSRNFSTIYKVALLYLGNKHDAEDVVQEVFMKYIDKAPSLHDAGYEKAWLITVAKNLCINHKKSFWQSHREELKDDIIPVQAERYEEQIEVLEELKKLKGKYRVVIYLYYYEGFTAREIAKMISKNESTVQTWLARGRKNLGESLGGVE